VPAAPDREVVERRIKNLQDQMGPAVVPTTPTASASATASAPSATASASAPVPTTTATATATAAPTGSSAPAPEAGGHGVAPWIVVGVGGAALVAGVVLYAVGNGDVTTASNACPSRLNCPQSVADQGNNGRTLETVGVVVGAVGVAGVAGGLIWHFMEPTSASTTAVSPVVAPGYAGLSLGGKF
jgi:hypothetical protein